MLWVCVPTLVTGCWTVIHVDTPSTSTGTSARLLQRILCLFVVILALKH